MGETRRASTAFHHSSDHDYRAVIYLVTVDAYPNSIATTGSAPFGISSWTLELYSYRKSLGGWYHFQALISLDHGVESYKGNRLPDSRFRLSSS